MQTSERVLAALKREASIGVPATGGAGGERLRLIDSEGLKYTRAPIPSEERPSSQLEQMARLGGINVDGAYNMEIVPGGAFDLLAESILRGTMDAKATHATISDDTELRKIATPEEPINTSYSIEQRDVDIDDSELFVGVRVVRLDLSMQPRRRAKATWTFKGLDSLVKQGAESPYYEAPNLPIGDSLIVDDASIYLDGVLVTVLTGLDITISIDSATQDVIGSFVSPDVFMNIMKVSGTISIIREDLAALVAFRAETEFEIRAVLSGPGIAERLTFAVRLPRCKFATVEAPFLGGQAAKVEQRTFTAHPPLGAFNTVELYTSTNTVTPAAESV